MDGRKECLSSGSASASHLDCRAREFERGFRDRLSGLSRKRSGKVESEGDVWAK